MYAFFLLFDVIRLYRTVLNSVAAKACDGYADIQAVGIDFHPLPEGPEEAKHREHLFETG